MVDLNLTFCISATTISGVSGIPCSKNAYKFFNKNCFQYTNSSLATPGKGTEEFQGDNVPKSWTKIVQNCSWDILNLCSFTF